MEFLFSSFFVESSSLFSNHYLKPNSNSLLERDIEINFWPLILILVSLSILFHLIASNQRKFILILRSFIQHSQARQLEREEYKLNKGASLGLIVIFVLMTGAFFQQFALHFDLMNKLDVTGIMGYFLIVAGIVIVYTGKFLANRVLTLLLDSYDEVREYLFNVILLNKAVGLTFLPLTIALFFTQIPKEAIFYCGIFFASFFYLLRIVRGFSIGYSTRTLSAFHLFLYLCALEILPLAVIVKLFMLRLL
jgi:hypothetical protein